MKKALLILFLATAALSAFAQSSGSKFHFGVKAMPALAWLRIDAPDETNLESDGLPFGFGYGLITDFGFAERYAFSTGLEVAYRGGKTKYVLADTGSASTTSVVSTKYSVQFIELPLTLKLKTNEIGYLTYFFQVGFAPGFAIRSRKNIDIDWADGTTTSKKNEDASDDINEFNISLLVGAGAEYNISGNTSLLFGLTFNNGFLDVLDDKPYEGSKVKGNSNYLALTVGVLF
jgi:opacity protein-like surface antigen